MNTSRRNRELFFLPVNTGFVTDGLPDQRCYDFYRVRSRHGLHCAIVGNAVIPGGHPSNGVCAMLSPDDAWSRLADAIAEQGALPGIQLSSAWGGYRGMTRFISRSKEAAMAEYKEIASAFSRQNIQDVVDSLRRGTEIAIAAGFRHLQLHAAHGYLFSLIVDGRLSSHVDFFLQRIQRWATELAAESIESSIRFSLFTGHSSTDALGNGQLVADLAQIPVTYLDASSGFYNIDKYLIYPHSRDYLSDRHNSTFGVAASLPETQFIMSGKAAQFMDVPLPSNIHLGLCRDLIANPDFLRDRAGGCNDCGECHYSSRRRDHISCRAWSITQAAIL